MTDDGPWFRSQRLLDRERSALLVVDVQTKLLPKISGHRRMLWNIGRLLRGAQAMQIPLGATEQYPQGLGETDPEIAELLPPRHEKLAFSLAAVRQLVAEIADRGVTQIVLCGIETHICVLQTALDLSSEGFEVYVASDAVGARGSDDHTVALGRMRDEGLTLVTTEGALFEWCRSAAEPGFKTVRDLVQESPPETPRVAGFK